MTSTELARLDGTPQAVTLFGTDDPETFLARAGKTAEALSKMLRAKQLTMKIQGRDYVRVEGWTALGSMLGVFAVCEWTRRLEYDGDSGWEARVTAVTRQGDLIGAAEASCMRSEKNWGNRDDYALRSMAQTRATSKALRQPLGFVVSMAGYESTPAEEMPVEGFASPASGPKATKAQIADVQALIALAIESGMDKDKIADGMVAEYGTAEPSELSKSQATNFLARLKARAG
jgi:hypothetical protein